ncbi:hypothetical protein BHE74_00045125 [Ensete ventricosum]|nr:hypothetical protein BHE74_00045125 [Ensete ventricosum]
MSSSSPSGSDDGDAFDADMEALRRACALTGADPADVGGAYLDSDSDSGSDDAGLLRRLQERFYSPSQAVDSFSLVKPLSYIAPMDLDDDDDDDFETLRAIQLRFTHQGRKKKREKKRKNVESVLLSRSLRLRDLSLAGDFFFSRGEKERGDIAFFLFF